MFMNDCCHHNGKRAAFGGFGRHRHGFGGHGHGQGRGRGLGERMGRVFDHGDLKLAILALLAEKPRHGYEIIKALEERVGGGYSPSPGVVYPTLTLLEEMGLAHATATEGSRKLFSPSTDGQSFLDANRAQVEAIFAHLDETRQRHAAPPAQILRAVENLHNALHLKLAGGTIDEPRAREISAAIDAAVNAIEEI